MTDDELTNTFAIDELKAASVKLDELIDLAAAATDIDALVDPELMVALEHLDKAFTELEVAAGLRPYQENDVY